MELPPSSIERVVASLASVDLGDPRRNRRLGLTVANLARCPDATFPEAMGSDGAVQGGYRLVNNRYVTLDALIEAQARGTADLAKDAELVLAIHDTTTCKFEHVDPAELGYLNTGKAGFRFHYTLAVDLKRNRRPLGVVHGEAVFRSKRPRKRRKGRASKPSAATTRKKPNREFERWQRGIDRAAEQLEGCSVVHVADRESDAYELMADCIARRRRFVFRARVTERRARDLDGEHAPIEALARKAQARLTREVPLSKRRIKSGLRTAHPGREARQALLSISATRVVMKRPHYLPKDLPSEVEINVVRVYEESPPAGLEPVEWLLYTTEPVDTEEQLALVVDIYRARWLIEECNKALKTGCLYEEREFESRAALLAVLGMSLPIACEILWLRTQARDAPDRPATQVLTPLQIEVVRALGSRKLGPAPTARDILLAVAAMVGHHRSNGDPGWRILQRGMTKLLAYEEGWRAALATRGNL